MDENLITESFRSFFYRYLNTLNDKPQENKENQQDSYIQDFQAAYSQLLYNKNQIQMKLFSSDAEKVMNPIFLDIKMKH